MKRYTLILCLLLVNTTNQWCCCCQIPLSDDEVVSSQEESPSSKRNSAIKNDEVDDGKIAKLNRETAKEITINRIDKKPILMQRFISDHVPMEWHLEISENPEQCIIISDPEIKKTNDAHPLSWYSWKIEGTKQGTAILRLHAIRNNLYCESDTVTVKVK